MYYARHEHGRFEGKLTCVVVIVSADEAFVATAYVTDTVKRGRLLWISEQ